jgi:tol-pal system protein YbgF
VERLESNNEQLARALNLLNQIQMDFQSIQGQVQASQYLTKESDRIYQDLDLRVSSLEDKIDQIHKLLKELTTTPKEVGTKPGASAKEYEEYQMLLNAVNARDWAGSASGFLGFIKKYPKSPYTGNARYWLGESYYSMGDFAKAIKEFQNLVDSDPGHPRVKEAIYKQGLCFSRLKKYPEAKLFFQKVMADYPNTAEAAKAQARLFRIEELEKSQPTSGPGLVSSSDTATNGSAPGQTVYPPIMKPVPMPRAVTPAPQTPIETTVPPPPVDSSEEGSRPANTGDSSAPLF